MRDPVTLPPADYWELRARIRDVEAVELDARKAAEQFKAKTAAALAARQACFERLVTAHGLDGTTTYGWDDATCALIPDEETPTA